MTAILHQNIADKLADEIIAKRRAKLQEKITRYPRRNPILSDISECDRQLVYGVKEWQSRELFTEDVQARLEAGNVQEREIIAELTLMRFEVTLSQMPVEINGKNGVLLATGKIDGFIKFEGQKVPLEIKSMNANIFNSIKDISDFQRKPYLRKYIRQLQMYMFGNNMEQGLFILTNCLGAWKLIPVYLDYGECEAILQRLERVQKALKDDVLPDRILYDSSICDHCPFKLICLQDIVNTPAEMIDDPGVVEMVDRHEELKPLASEFDEIHEKIKDSFGALEKVFIGSKYLIQNVPSQRTVYELTDEAKAKIESIKKEFQTKVPTKRMVIQHLDNKPAL